MLELTRNRRRSTMSWMVAVVLTVAAICAQPAKAVDVAGNWVAEITGPTLLEPAYARVTLQRAGNNLTGNWGANSVKGSVNGSDIILSVTDAQGNAAGSLNGEIKAEEIAGGGVLAGLGRRGRTPSGRPPVPVEMKFTLTREPVAPVKAREINYSPTTFQAYYYAGN